MHFEKNTELSNHQNRLLKSIVDMQNDFIRRGIYYGWCNNTLENLLFLTESEFGFICELLRKNDGTPYIKSHGITNIAWNDQTRRFYDENKEKGLEFFNFESLWGKAVTTGEPVIANDPDSDYRRGGFLKDSGHPKLKSFLGLPIRGSEGKVVGVIGVANRFNGYDKEIVDFLSPFLTSYGMLIEKYRSDQKRKNLEVEHEKIISDLKHSQQALQKSKALLDATGRMARVGGWELDAKTLEVTWTDATYRIHEVPIGFKPPLQEAINFFHPEDRPKLEKAIRRALDHGEPYDMELRFTTANGKDLWARTKCEPEVMDGKVIKLKGTFQDITERKQAEEALQASERELKQILEATTDGIWTWNFKTNELTFSPKSYTMLGYEPDEFPANYENWLNLIHPDDRQKALAVAEEYLKTKPDEYKNEFRLRSSTGDYRRILATARVAERDKNGDAVYMIGNHQDITESRKAEEALRKSEEQYRMLVDTANDAIFIAQDGAIKFPNPKTTDITGYSADELAKMPFTDIIHPEDRDLVVGRHLQRLKGENPPSHYSFRIINKAGEEMYVQINATLISWKDRPATINIIRDITEQKQLEDRLRQSQRMESIGDMAGGIAHDFNNILFPIVGLSEMILEDLPKNSPEYEKTLQIYNAGKRGSDLVKQILAFSRQSEQKKIPTRIQQILKEVMKLSRSAIPVNISIKQNIQSDCGMVLADPTQIHQIAMNLITNAYHAVEPKNGSIDVSLKEIDVGHGEQAESHLLQGRYAVLSVSDTGIGIDPAIKEKIFEPYFTTKEQGKGTGLGLAVVYGIVKEHHGDIKVYSELGKGTTFKVYLPIMEKTEKKSSVLRDKELPTGHERILLVDDEEAIAKLEKQILERLGYKVTMRVNSLEALEAFKSKPDSFDLVISDMTMPQITGDRLAREMITIRPDTPIIICTGFSERLNQEKAASIGVKGFLMKPIAKSDIARMVRKVLDEAKSGDNET